MAKIKYRKLLMHETYRAEGLCDVERHVAECFDEAFNPIIKDLPEPDEYGFRSGTFIVTVEWEPEKE